jgi:predicted O-methyltransferase YrrM
MLARLKKWWQWLNTTEYSRPCRDRGLAGTVKRWYQRRQMLRGWARLYGDDTAATTVHLFELLRSVHEAGLPTADLQPLVDSLGADRPQPRPAARIHPLLFGDGSGSAGEMAALALITAARRPRCVLELGTYNGCSTWHLWANSPDDARLVTLDLPSDSRVASSTDAALQGVPARPFLPADPRVRLVEADTRLWAPDLDAPADLCFIDAGHSYECVRNDTEKALSVLAADGLLVWHDATWTRDGYGVNRYLRELHAAGHPVRLVRLSLYDYCGLAVRLPEPRLSASA